MSCICFTVIICKELDISPQKSFELSRVQCVNTCFSKKKMIDTSYKSAT